jgi:putative ABC transport system permease protein
MPPKKSPQPDHRLYRALLRLLPLDFRIEHGREMEQAFQSERRDARDGSRLRGTIQLWLGALRDLLATAPRQHFAMLQQDVSYALRSLKRTPGFTAAAVLTLGVGVCATAIIFTIINAFLFRPLPVPRADELVSIATAGDQHIEMPHGVSYRDLEDYQALRDTFTGLLGYRPHGMWLSARNSTDRIVLEAFTENSFPLLGVTMAAGRAFGPGDRRTPVLVLSHDYWRSRFGGDPRVIGEQVRLDGQTYTVIGVTEERFRGLESLLRVSAFMPISMLEDRASASAPSLFDARDRHELGVIGRLAPGVGLDQARAALTVTVDALAAAYPATNKGVSLQVVPETHARPVPQNGPMFHVAATTFAILAGLLLLITSANVANMLLARAAARGREIALRAALGARRGRIVRQLVTESVVLALAGGAGAILLARPVAAAMERGVEGLSFNVPLRVNFALDWRVLAVTLVLATLAGGAAGLAPALYARRVDLDALLRAGGQRAGGERGRVRGLLVVAQVAVSLVLLVVGGLFAKTLDRARAADLGFRSERVLLLSVDLSPLHRDAAQRLDYYRTARERVAGLPGVQNAAWISGLPFSFDQDQSEVLAAGRPAPPPGQNRISFGVSVGPDYFATANVPILAGRALDERDTADAPPVTVVNQALAELLWPGDNPIGRRLTLQPAGTQVEVVGLAKDGKYVLLWESARAMLFRPLAQDTPSSATLEVLTAQRPESVANAVRATLQAADPDVPVFDVQPMTEYLEHGGAFLLFRLGALFTGTFGVVGLLLASIGLYGVVAFDVTRRTHEIGVRMALGASRGTILREVVTRGAWLVAPGTLAGLAMAGAAAWGVRTMLLGVSPFDPITYGRTAALLLVVSLVAALVPARRAASRSQLDALRAD